VYFFTKYFESYKAVIAGIDGLERSPILKGIGKFLATLKLIFDMLPFIVIIGGSIGILFGWRP
jgi:hypothetical protein